MELPAVLSARLRGSPAGKTGPGCSNVANVCDDWAFHPLLLHTRDALLPHTIAGHAFPPATATTASVTAIATATECRGGFLGCDTPTQTRPRRRVTPVRTLGFISKSAT